MRWWRQLNKTNAFYLYTVLTLNTLINANVANALIKLINTNSVLQEDVNNGQCFTFQSAVDSTKEIGSCFAQDIVSSWMRPSWGVRGPFGLPRWWPCRGCFPMTIASEDSRPAVMLSLSDVRAGRKKRKDRDSSLDRNFLRVPLSALKPSKSTSNLANRGLYGEKVELSTEGSIPGVLKVFGDSVVPGTNYKSVLVTLNTAAHELVQAALERYGIHEAPVRDFVLCEVVGRMSEELSGEGAVQEFWTEECVRLVGMHERPLVLQQFWKPTEGCARRFELRKRTELMAWPDSPDLDSPTSILTGDGRSLLSQSPNSGGDASDRTSLIYRTDSDVTLPVDIDSSSLSNGEPVFISR